MSTISDPSILSVLVHKVIVNNDDITVVASNVLSGSTSSFSTVFSSVAPAQQSQWAYAALTSIASNEAIADLGATQIFIMDDIPVHNKRKTTCPLKVALADGCRVMSTHMCDIVIPGLPTTLIGHIVPELSITSLFGIRVLTEAGCMIKFDNKKCVVRYHGKISLIGMKDPTTDLWTLPIVSTSGKTSLTDTPKERDPFANLRKEFLEATSLIIPSSMAWY
jgi:hypothetical protein